jgi:transposase
LTRGWAKRGERLRVPTKSEHRKRLNLFGWVAPLLGKKGLMRAEAGNTEAFLEALQQLSRKLRNYYIWLYVDRAPWHKGEEVEFFVHSHIELHLEYLPPYQPALNPQERIWKQARYEITRNSWFPELESMHKLIIHRIHHWSPKKIKQLCNIN